VSAQLSRDGQTSLLSLTAEIAENIRRVRRARIRAKAANFRVVLRAETG